ncbi:hypothetical protein [Paenibacillus solani]|uniref:hypothetical protein n=1 Tax=Paenibacillus solani TaxID=1705565 RepID=UPI003D2D3659
MKIRMLFIMVLLIVSFMPACSKAGDNKNQETHNQNPTTINISLYRTDSTKVQPELINVVGVGDPHLLKQAYDWKKDGIQSIQAALPYPDKIDRIYVLQYSYEGANPRSEYFMYVTDSEGNNYIKQFEYNGSYDSYQGSLKKEDILNKIGLDGWKKVSAIEWL